MMYYIESTSTDPYFNLALEQYVFDKLNRSHSYFMLWQNHNAIIVGKYQNTAGEINADYVKEKDIAVVRRLSGGGAVYHDLGNLNFTFIMDSDGGAGLDFAAFCRPVAAALGSLGVTVELSGRNDMTIDGKKFSGNSQYRKQGRVMHHGTILYDSDLHVVGQALQVSKDKIESKGIQSVRSRVTNVRPYLERDVPIREFWDSLRDYLSRENDMAPYHLTEEDLQEVCKLRSEVYSRWEWNYGASPAYSIQKSRRVEGCGKLEISINVGKNGIVEDLLFQGDFFTSGNPAELADMLKGRPLEESALRETLADVDIGRYFHNLKLEDFLSILLQ